MPDAKNPILQALLGAKAQGVTQTPDASANTADPYAAMVNDPRFQDFHDKVAAIKAAGLPTSGAPITQTAQAPAAVGMPFPTWQAKNHPKPSWQIIKELLSPGPIKSWYQDQPPTEGRQ